ncbi:hypothetical protein SAMN02910358_02277 [Lachnospiraceae bacterium XBB1006]|nr:hypothetical protein SAMN02910358_02277 [Lachnospiraceae bacterium XBB1006]
MAGLNGIMAYQQAAQTWQTNKKDVERVQAKDKAEAVSPQKEEAKVEKKAWSPLESGSSLIPKKTEYGMTIGNVQLSEQAADYLEKLKGKFHNMEFITVSNDMKQQVKQNAAAYGNANKMVVLIDEEKLERMATDEDFRKKYEGIISMSQTKLETAKNSLASSGASVKNFGMSVDENGKESFFATVEKSSDLQKKRIEKKAAEKKVAKKAAEKKAEKKKAEKKKAEKTEAEKTEEEEKDDKKYVTFTRNSWEALLEKVQSYSYDHAANYVRTKEEQAVGTQIDFRG